MRLKGKTAVVTGSSKGIGKAIARQLATEGADVAVCAHRSLAEAELVVKEVESCGVRSMLAVIDLAELADVNRFVRQVWDWNAGVDIWVNNAGVDVLTGPVAELEFFTKLQRLWEVDVVGSIACARQVGKLMKQAGGGTIVNIGWDQACHGMEGDSGEMFATIKGAVMAFTKSLAKSLAPDVRVNCVAPGWVKTDWGEEAPEYWQSRALNEALCGRWGTPNDIAEAVSFLVSPAAEFINGHILPVNGGFRNASTQ